jgi:hypothetical protein
MERYEKGDELACGLLTCSCTCCWLYKIISTAVLTTVTVPIMLPIIANLTGGSDDNLTSSEPYNITMYY